MPAKPQDLKFKQTIDTSPAEAFHAFTNSTALREWLCDAAMVDLRKSGRIHLWWRDNYHTTGEFTALAPDRKVAFTWRGSADPGVTRVQVSFAAKKGRTVVTLTHAGVGAGKAWAATRAGLQHEWVASLENLKSVLETGHDLRFTLRPMVGINIGDYNAEIARRLGVPVTEGIHLDGTHERMGAYAAGLRKDDVLVGLAGKKLTDWASLAAALQSHRAGDEVKVAYYRGPEKRTTLLKLSARPMPEIPATAEGLAQAMRKIYAESDAEIAHLFDGVTEEEAACEPAPGEWSAKEVLCHLIVGERDQQAWIGYLLGGHEPWWDKWGGNIRQRHTAVMAVASSVSDFLEMLKHHELETVAMLAALPADFVARKGSYWRVAYNLLQTTDHNSDHVRQIRETIEAARTR